MIAIDGPPHCFSGTCWTVRWADGHIVQQHHMGFRARPGAPVSPAELHAWRQAAGYSLSELATRLDVDRMTIWRWESGKRAIPGMLRLALQGLEHCRATCGTSQQDGCDPNRCCACHR